jgi:hypothetical protein
MRSATTGAPAVRHLRVLPDQTSSSDYTLTTSSPKQYSLICFGCRFTSIVSVLAPVLIHPHGLAAANLFPGGPNPSLAQNRGSYILHARFWQIGCNTACGHGSSLDE